MCYNALFGRGIGEPDCAFIVSVAGVVGEFDCVGVVPADTVVSFQDKMCTYRRRKEGAYYSFVPSSLGSRCSAGGFGGGFIAEISLFEVHKKKFIEGLSSRPRESAPTGFFNCPLDVELPWPLLGVNERGLRVYIGQ